MWTLLVAVVLSQAEPADAGIGRVAVIDISADDAIYEDVSRRYCESLVEALTKAGVPSVRVDESELPPEGCKLGPCLGVAARGQGAVALVTLDAEELSEKKSKVVVTLMRSTNGEPLAGGRYELVVGAKKPPKGLTQFLGNVKKAMSRLASPR